MRTVDGARMAVDARVPLRRLVRPDEVKRASVGDDDPPAAGVRAQDV